nr:unnamed protein product [Digitaria exilis]
MLRLPARFSLGFRSFHVSLCSSQSRSPARAHYSFRTYLSPGGTHVSPSTNATRTPNHTYTRTTFPCSIDLHRDRQIEPNQARHGLHPAAMPAGVPITDTARQFSVAVGHVDLGIKRLGSR